MNHPNKGGFFIPTIFKVLFTNQCSTSNIDVYDDRKNIYNWRNWN